MSAPVPGRPGSWTLVRLVAGREVSTRLRDRTFLISSAVILVLVIGAMVFQAVLAARGSSVTVGVVGDRSALAPALTAQGRALQVGVTVEGLPDEAAARRAVTAGDVDGALLTGGGGAPRLLVDREAPGSLQAVVQGAVSSLAVSRQLAAAGVPRLDAPQVGVVPLQPDADRTGQRVVAAIIGVSLLYTLLALLGQFVAQGVVEEKASRVVELLLATMRPWQLLAGKILGLGLLGLAQIVLLAVIGVVAAGVAGLVTVPTALIGTVATVVAWFVLGYALYAAVFAAAASLVSRQEDLPAVTTPTTFLLLAGLFIAIQAVSDPGGTLARVTSFVPGLSPLVMPVRQAAGGVAAWEVAAAVVLMLAAIALVVRLGGRVYAGALLRTGGRTRIREALAAGRP